MALVQCMSCSNKMIEDEEAAILECLFCGSTVIEVIEN